MNRRDFALASASTAACAALFGPAAAHAQGGPVEGTNYVKLGARQPTQDPKKIEVVEFFWYGCPHCASFEPMLETWAKKLPADVNFRRMPVAFREVPYVIHQKLYFAIETMGLLDSLHRKVFNAMHVEKLKLDTPDSIGEFVAKNGVDKAKFLDTMNSFGIATRAKQAAALSIGYKIDGTPAMGIDGSYFTSGSMAGGNDRALAVTDFLVARIRKGA
ncbi:MAG TPA: thiol:disulfide interchange protein DsbA/DsbL [Methylibium sp.]|uniref:thiol:disulfide interchange protein DsbA/DsbL n=1 Tax=Methylibium sp. TaxID=2067992 RepID=UPI002DB98937|nr:thiol:disulfide interchange protein DsbA/DsbL [Methylibium sp.]HEU4460370.1 thiol:disulfide interchange protein DsbA/DsbL [Methylibium sp.]